MYVDLSLRQDTFDFLYLYRLNNLNRPTDLFAKNHFNNLFAKVTGDGGAARPNLMPPHEKVTSRKFDRDLPFITATTTTPWAGVVNHVGIGDRVYRGSFCGEVHKLPRPLQPVRGKSIRIRPRLQGTVESGSEIGTVKIDPHRAAGVVFFFVFFFSS